MAISGTYTFNPDISEIVQEAYEQAGLDLRSGYDLFTARRSLNLLTIEWQNRGLNLWTIDEQKVSEDSDDTALTTNYLNKGTSAYNLGVSTSALLDVILRTNDGVTSTQSDYRLNRISQPVYATIPNKLSQGRPVQFYLQRKGILDVAADGADQNNVITLWPVPDKDTTYKIVYWRVKRIADAGQPVTNTMQVPDRFIPALISGLAYQIALKRPEVSERAPLLKQVYEEAFALAAEEDREKASVRFTPNISGY